MFLAFLPKIKLFFQTVAMIVTIIQKMIDTVDEVVENSKKSQVLV